MSKRPRSDSVSVERPTKKRRRVWDFIYWYDIVDRMLPVMGWRDFVRFAQATGLRLSKPQIERNALNDVFEVRWWKIWLKHVLAKDYEVLIIGDD
ncbi:hypothetical protein MMC25_008355, partial [Agyrium rufum]|nr:hypothetical protein [Agyrium rufum]